MKAHLLQFYYCTCMILVMCFHEATKSVMRSEVMSILSKTCTTLLCTHGPCEVLAIISQSKINRDPMAIVMQTIVN